MAGLKVPHTFEIRPTAPDLAQGARPDELMIDWRTLPPGTAASIYLPAVDAPAAVARAVSLYGSTTLTASDPHTLVCPARDLTYVPVPASTESSLSGLLVIEPPGTVAVGQRFRVGITQLTSVARVPGADDTPVVDNRFNDTGVRAAARRGPWGATTAYRRVLGTVHLSIPVVAGRILRPVEERQLSVLRWVLDGVAPADRNYLTFRRYVEVYAERVAQLGGDPDLIPPSATGTWPGGPGPAEAGSGNDGLGGTPGDREVSGQVVAVIFDHFGDFEGFVVETDRGERVTFSSHHGHVCELARHAMAARLRVSVAPEGHHPRGVRRLVLHQTP